MLTENEVANISKKLTFFFAVLKRVLKFLYQKGKHSCMFFVDHRTVFSQVHICHNLSWHHIELCAQVSAQMGLTAHMVGA